MKYQIIRFYAKEDHPDNRKVIKENLTLEEAQEHCSKEETHKPGVWFDGYEKMS